MKILCSLVVSAVAYLIGCGSASEPAFDPSQCESICGGVGKVCSYHEDSNGQDNGGTCVCKDANGDCPADAGS
jgi:hypothetical protein